MDNFSISSTNVRICRFEWPKKRYAIHEPWPDHLLKDIQKNPSDALSVHMLVQWVDSGTAAQAEARTREVVRLFPDRDLIHEAFAKVYLQGGKGLPKGPHKAKEHLLKAILLNPDEEEFHLLLRDTYRIVQDERGVAAAERTLFLLRNPTALFPILSKQFLDSLNSI